MIFNAQTSTEKIMLWSWDLQWFLSLPITRIMLNFRFFALIVLLLQAFQCPILTYLLLAFYTTYTNLITFIMQPIFLAFHQYQPKLLCNQHKPLQKNHWQLLLTFVSNFSFPCNLLQYSKDHQEGHSPSFQHLYEVDGLLISNYRYLLHQNYF